MTQKYLELYELSAYKIAREIAKKVWDIVSQWDFFVRDTVGKQLVRSADSISANIAEGYGRYFKREKIQFRRYTQGSTHETIDWLQKAQERNLISRDVYQPLDSQLQSPPREINSLIKYFDEKLTK